MYPARNGHLTVGPGTDPHAWACTSDIHFHIVRYVHHVIHISHRNRKGYLGLQTWYPGSKCIMVAEWAALSKKSKIGFNHCLWFAAFSLYINDGKARTAFFKFRSILEPEMNWVVQCWCNELVFLWMILVAAEAAHFYILHLSWSCLFFPLETCHVWFVMFGQHHLELVCAQGSCTGILGTIILLCSHRIHVVRSYMYSEHIHCAAHYRLWWFPPSIGHNVSI